MWSSRVQWTLSLLLVVLGSVAASAQTYNSPANLYAVNDTNFNYLGANPYPIPITVSGFSGSVSTVSVTLNHLADKGLYGNTYGLFASTAYLLVSPDGRAFAFLAQPCINAPVGGTPTLTIADSGSAALQSDPVCSTVTTATYKPAMNNLRSNFDFTLGHTANPPAGAQFANIFTNYAAPTGSPDVQGIATFTSVFGGMSAAQANGTWYLYIEITGNASGQNLTIGDSTNPAINLNLTASVVPATTTTVATSGSPILITPPATSSSNATFTATVTPNPGAGFVTFADISNPISPVNLQCAQGVAGSLQNVVLNASGQAQCTTTFNTQNAHVVRASWAGNGSFGPSNATVVEVVNTATTNPVTNRYCNTGTISFPGLGAPSGTFRDPAFPFPAIINVSGLTGKLISNVTVTLNLVDNKPLGMSILLENPGGKALEIFSYTGGADTSPSTRTLILDDNAAAGHPKGSNVGGAAIPGGTYQPTSYLPAGGQTTYCGSSPCSGAVISAGAPASFDRAGPVGLGSLIGEFGGTDPNGTWSLFFSDHIDVGTINGWCLDFTVTSGTATATTLQSSNPSSNTGASVTLTAAVTTSGNSIGANGTVTFIADGTTLPGAANVPVGADGHAVFSTTALSEGTHDIRARFNGTASLGVSTSPALLQRVDDASTATFTCGSSGSCTAQICNTPASGAGIFAPLNGQTTGGGAPYPSNLFITNLPGTVQGLTVSLNGFVNQPPAVVNGGSPDDIQNLLVGPTGANIDFFSHAGSQISNPAINLVFSDAAAIGLVPDLRQVGNPAFEAPLTSGTYLPTSWGPGTNGAGPGNNAYPSCPGNIVCGSVGPPAPQSGISYAQPAGSATLGGRFGGTDGNGTWSYYLTQVFPSEQVAVGSWCLNFTENRPVLSVTKSDGGLHFLQGQQGAHYTFTVTNAGPGQTGGNVPTTVTDVLPSGVTFASGSGTGWDCSASTSTTAVCTNASNVAAGSAFPVLTVNVNVAANTALSPPHTVSNSAAVSGGGAAGSVSSNTVVTTVDQAADLSVSKSGPASANAGSAAGFDYTLTVTNNGFAPNVGGFTVTDTLPAGLTFSAGGSDPTCSAVGQAVSCTPSPVVGLAVNATRVFTVHVTLGIAVPSGTVLHNQASVSSNGVAPAGTPDTNPSNNTSTTVDTTATKPPTTVVSIQRHDADPTNASSVSFDVTFGEALSGLTASNFTLAHTGLTGSPSITSVTAVGAQPAAVWSVATSTGGGDGTLGLNLTNDSALDHVLTNLAFNGEQYTLDRTPPTVSAIVRTTPAGPSTGAHTVTFTVTFSEAVTGVDPSDFVIVASGLTTAVPVSVAGSGATYAITVSDVTGNGTLGLNLVDDDSIADAAGNKLGGTGAGNGNLTGEVYTIDQVFPHVVSIDRTSPLGPATNAGSVDFMVVFSESVSGVDAGDFSLALAGVTATTPVGVSGSGDTYTVTVSGISGSGTLGLNLTDDGSIRDAAGNPLAKLAAPAAFQNQTTVAMGSTPEAVALADVNGDGLLDLVVANLGDATVGVRLGNGDGTFQSAAAFATGLHPAAVAVGDLNRDGKPDIVAANFGAATVSILLGNGNGTFQPQSTATTGAGPQALAIADLDRDGNLDLVVVDTNADRVSVLLGHGDGTFAPQALLAVGSVPRSVVVADFNVDGYPDLAVVNNNGSTVSVLLGNGNGSFQSQSAFAVGANPVGIAAADLNGDLKLDLMVTNGVDNDASVLLGNGNGTFQGQTTVATGAAPVAATAIDVNGDAEADLVVANQDDNGAGVLLGHGNGTFQSQAAFAVGTHPVAMASGDLNGDGRVDFAVANMGSDTVSLLLSSGNGDFSGQVYALDQTPPAVSSIVRANPAGPVTNASSVTYTVTFTENVTGVDPTDFVATVAGGVSVTPTVGVSGSGAVYSVTVSGVSGNGTVRLDLVDDDSIQDSVGNPLGGAAPGDGSLNGEVYTVDQLAPSVSSIQRTTPAGPVTNATTVSYTVTFSENVTGVDAADFSLSLSGVAATAPVSVSGSGTTFVVTIGGINGNGTLELDLVDDDSIVDVAGNPLGGTGAGNGNFLGEAYTIDQTAPAVVSLLRTTPAGPLTNASSVVYTLVFSKAVTGVDASDFGLALSGVTTVPPVVVLGSGATYTVTISGISGSGTLGLDLVDDDSIQDQAGNALGGTGGGNGNATGEVYTVDQTAPVVVSILRATPLGPLTNATSVVYAVTFSKPVSGVDGADFNLALTGTVAAAPAPVVSGSGSSYSVTVNGLSGEGTLTLKLTDDDSIQDSATNPLAGQGAGNGNFTGEAYTLGTAPGLTSADHVTFRVASAGTFTVVTTGFPAPTISETGPLPGGVTLVDQGDGTALLSGTPDPGSDGVYILTLKATNGIGADATQTFTLSVLSQALDFYSLSPCRLIDTRNPDGPAGGPKLGSGQAREFVLTGACGIPTTAKAVALTMTVVAPTTSGDLRVYRADLQIAPRAVVMSFKAGRTRAGDGIVGLSVDAQGRVLVQNDSTGTLDLILDVSGYFQ